MKLYSNILKDRIWHGHACIYKTVKNVLGSAYLLGRALTSILWGMIANRYGRKPVVIIGIISVVIFNTLFDLCTNLWMAVMMRFLLGCLNGLLVPMKAYSSEIFREEYQALGQSTVCLTNLCL
ncbi:Protein ZINC INDUCED FACILITATOR-LIKE 1 [Trifolium repens]|nr:protein ZINC INDUCED FACILITATOR-LIKE [Trifolium repens]WJX83851.1 Protein ZINC INDUCED FACILITATOR-LIKE 1 [Trifolium repens]